MHKPVSFCLFIPMLFSVLSDALAADWPQWRGPGRDGVWTETNIIKSFTGGSLPGKWRAAIGAGYSGPTVANGLVYVTDRVTAANDSERVHCFRESDGQRVWSFGYECRYRNIGYPAGPRASVLLHAGRAYSLGSMGHLYCFDAFSGRVLWQRNLDQEYEIRMPVWGIAASPLVEKELLILQIGGSNNACVIALEQNTGKEVWRNLNDEACYSAPIVIDQAGQRVLVVWTAARLAGLDPCSGRLHWSVPFVQDGTIMGIATPVVYRDKIFVSSFFQGSLLVQVDPGKLAAKELWRRRGKSERLTDGLHCCISTPVLMDHHIYGVDSYGELRCLDLTTGERIWEDLNAVTRDRWANIHLVQNGAETWMFNEHGELLITRLSALGLQVISRAMLIEPTTGQMNRKGKGVTWSHPAFANRHIFIRNDRELLCASLAAGKKQ